MVSEAELLEGIRARSQAAAALVFELYGRRVRGQAIVQLGTDNADVVDDVVSEAFTRFFDAVLERQADVVSIGGLLCAIARNLAVDHFRTQRRLVLVSDFDDAHAVHFLGDRDIDGAIADGRWSTLRAATEIDNRFECETARAAFARLPSSAQTLLMLVIDSDESIGRLAVRFGTTPQGLSSAIYRIVERLRQEFIVSHVLPSDAPGCWRCLRSLGAYVRGDLRPRRHDDVVSHLRSCSGCSARLAAALEADAELPHARRRSASDVGHCETSSDGG